MITLLTLILYPVAIQYEKEWKWKYKYLYYFTGVLDIIANYTEVSCVYGLPDRGEWTISRRLRKLSKVGGIRGKLAAWSILYVNYFQPGHVE